MINQMWTQTVFDKVATWEAGMDKWIATLPVDRQPVDCMLLIQQGLTGDAYNAALRENLKKMQALRAEYDAINPCPVRRFVRK